MVHGWWECEKKKNDKKHTILNELHIKSRLADSCVFTNWTFVTVAVYCIHFDCFPERQKHHIVVNLMTGLPSLCFKRIFKLLHNFKSQSKYLIISLFFPYHE